MYNARGKTETSELLAEYSELVRRLAFLLKAKLPPSVEVGDLVQVGMMGLLEAISRYQQDQGVKFATFATQRIRGAMLDELRNSDWVPRSLRQNLRKVEEAIRTLQHRLGRAPTEPEMADYLAMSLEDYQHLLAEGAGCQLMYYEDLNESAAEGQFLDQVPEEQDANPLHMMVKKGLKKDLVEAINALPDREKLLMALYYEQDLNLKEVGAVMGVTESRVSQLHTQAMLRLRTHLREKAWIEPA